MNRRVFSPCARLRGGSGCGKSPPARSPSEVPTRPRCARPPSPKAGRDKRARVAPPPLAVKAAFTNLRQFGASALTQSFRLLPCASSLPRRRSCPLRLAVPAGAETRIFIVENQPDGYGVDQCLASGANCGKPVARAYCQSREYDRAVSFRKIEPRRDHWRQLRHQGELPRPASAANTSPSSARDDRESVISSP